MCCRLIKYIPNWLLRIEVTSITSNLFNFLDNGGGSKYRGINYRSFSNCQTYNKKKKV